MINYGTDWNEFRYVAWEDGGGWMYRASSEEEGDTICNLMASHGHCSGRTHFKNDVIDFIRRKGMSVLSERNIYVPEFSQIDTSSRLIDKAIFSIELSAKRIDSLSKSLRKKCDFENARLAKAQSDAYKNIVNYLKQLKSGEI